MTYNLIENKFENIPAEMKATKQWICWKLEFTEGREKPTKIPYSANSGWKASVTNSATFSTFENCVSKVNQKLFDGIGFVLTKDDPFVFIDLDDSKGDELINQKYKEIIETMDTYTEVSPSGKGFHIIAKGKLGDKGIRKGTIEIYDNARYMTMTGFSINSNREVNERQGYIEKLIEEISGNVIKDNELNFEAITLEHPVKNDDLDLIQIALNAQNGDKFRELYFGEWQARYQSQSEADMALIAMITFYTKNNEQIKRIFRMSKLGERDKAKRDKYLDGIIQKIISKIPAEKPIDISLLEQLHKSNPMILNSENISKISENENSKNISKISENETSKNSENFSENSENLEIKIEKEIELNPKISKKENDFPPGNLGLLSRYIYDTSPRQAKEIAIIASLAIASGICGRAFQFSGTGLNMYYLLLANTGVGKDEISRSGSKIFQKISKNFPQIFSFRGADDMASGQALKKFISEGNTSFYSVMGEFTSVLSRISNEKASAHDVQLKKMLLDIYMKSGKGQTMEKTIYADSSKNTRITTAPAVTLVGENNPEEFYKLINESMITNGLLPRFLVLDYQGARQYLNKNHDKIEIDPDLLQLIEDLAKFSYQLNQNNQTVEVTCEPEVTEFLEKIDMETTDIINSNMIASNINAELWSRAHLKIMRISALLAVFDNFENPIITMRHAEYCKELVYNSTIHLINKFKTGNVGSELSESRQYNEVKRIIREYIRHDSNYLDYKKNLTVQIFEKRLLPYRFLQQKLFHSKSFKEDKKGATKAINNILKIMVDIQELEILGFKELESLKLSPKTLIYKVVNNLNFK